MKILILIGALLMYIGFRIGIMTERYWAKKYEKKRNELEFIETQRKEYVQNGVPRK